MDEERAAVEAFLALLEQEAQALIGGKFSDLALLTERKGQLADRIAVLDHEREQQLQELGYPTNRAGADAAAAAGGDGLQRAWQRLLSCAATSRDLNHRNGILIHTHLEFSRNAINFLSACGQSLYGPDGQHRVGRGVGKSLASG